MGRMTGVQSLTGAGLFNFFATVSRLPLGLTPTSSPTVTGAPLGVKQLDCEFDCSVIHFHGMMLKYRNNFTLPQLKKSSLIAPLFYVSLAFYRMVVKC
jgi:hypothetical protein